MLHERLDAAVHAYRQDGTPVAAVFIDLDDFKLVNDAHGHARGDEVLVGLTAEWQASLPRDVLLGRRGGDEFALLFPGRTLAEAEDEVRALSDDLCGWSAGLAEWDGGHDLADLFAAADADLYVSKARGSSSDAGQRRDVEAGTTPASGAADGPPTGVGQGMGSESAAL
jgi:diguanylate cyclase (GGDEF)-like protein